DVAVFEERARGNSLRRAEPNGAACTPFCVPAAHRVVNVQDCGIALALIHEQARLRFGVVCERVMSIQMIRRNVEARADLRPELLRGLELETGKLEHVPLIRPRRSDHRTWRAPDVSADLRGRSENVSGERRSGRLAIGAGDADDRSLQVPACEF